MAAIYDLVAETSTTTGTGPYTVGGAIAGRRLWSVVTNGNQVEYLAYELDGSDEITGWERGLGTYTAGSLTRDSISSSSNSNNAVSWTAGTRYVELVASAADIAKGVTANGWGNHASAGYSTFNAASPGTIGGTTPGVVNATTVNTSGDITEQTSTAATAGNQQNSPKTRWIGSGWKTNATAGAQAVEFAAQVKPVQGAAAPTGKLALMHSINGAALSESWSLYSDGNWTEETNGGRVGKATTGGAAGICIGRNDGKTVFIGSYGSMAAGICAGSSGFIGFAGAGDTVGTSTDPLDANGVYFKRDSAGVFKIVDLGGTNLRDLKLRNLIATNLIKNAHFTTATRPAFSNGDQFFDDDLDKLVVGGVAAWEVVTSV